MFAGYKKHGILIGLILVAVVLAALVGAIAKGSLMTNVVAAAQANASEIICESGKAHMVAVDSRLVLTCDETIPEPTATITPTVEPTATVTPTITVTPTVTPTITPTQPPGNVDPYPEAPLCLTHDDRAFHTLWNYQLGCHYDHTHGDDPNELNDKFGFDLFDMMGGEVGYVWGTHGENSLVKHKSYMWFTGEDLPCVSDNTDGCVTDYRVFVHNDLHNVYSSMHSALVEARVCDELNPTRCGYMLISGHQLAGNLRIDNNIVISRPPPSYGPRPDLLHYDQTGNQQCATWYPTFTGWMRVSTETCDMPVYFPLPTEPLPLADPNTLQYVRLAGDLSSTQLHVLGLGIPGRYRGLVDPDGDGLANYNGYINVMTAVPGDDCVQLSEMCAPLILENVPIVTTGFQYRGEYNEYDILFNGQPSGWITFPGFDPPR